MSSLLRQVHTKKVDSDAILEIIRDNDFVVVSFAGNGSGINNMPTFEFKNFLTSNFPKASLIFLKDANLAWYNKGLAPITNSVLTTAELLRNKIRPYKRAFFIGSSSGGYAAILFGSLLKVSRVIAFRPQTKVKRDFIDEKYSDLKPLINSTTLYYIYGETCNPPGQLHSFEQCENIAGPTNVIVDKMDVLDLRALRDKGWLKSELTKYFQ